MTRTFLRPLVGALALALTAVACQTPTSSSTSTSTSSSAPAAIKLGLTKQVVPIGERSFVIATVHDAGGAPVSGATVEWTNLQGGVGAIVEIDDRSRSADKVTGQYARTVTASSSYTLDMGTASTADDLVIKEGQTWVAMTSAADGGANVLASCPDVSSWSARNATAAPQWRDVVVYISEGQSGRIGQAYDLEVEVARASDGAPLAGQIVRMEVQDGNSLLGNSQSMLTLTTDKNGHAKTTVKPTKAASSSSTVAVAVARPANAECCTPEVPLGVYEREFGWTASAIEIAKTAPAKAVVGDNFNYALVVKNSSDMAALDARVTDTLPAGIEYVSSNPRATVKGQTLSWALGDIAAKGQKSISITVKATRTGTFENCADVSAEEGRLKDRDCATTVVTAPALSLAMTATPEALSCDEITYQLTVTNRGDAPARDVVIKDTLPQGVATLDGKRALDIQVGTLNAGQSKSYTIKAKAASSGRYVNKAVATSGNLSDDASATTVVTTPKLAITKTGPERRFVGRPVEYTITVRNTGDGVARDTVVVDTLPAGTTYRSATAGAQVADGRVTWTIGTLRPNDTRTFKVTVVPTADGRVTNRAVARAECAEAVSADASTSIEGIPAILVEVVDLEDPIAVGENTTYRITVTNQGSANGRNIVVKATLAAEQAFVSAGGATTGSASGRTVTFSPLASLAPGRTATFNVTVRATAAKDVRFGVSVTSAQSPEPITETESTYQYE
ncbi:MAG: COG1361 S-layer family protein [Planctomycetota bacterium]|jgi:uncharacterized repeat protein (TIGR01451 family)